MGSRWVTYDFRKPLASFSDLPKTPGVYAIYIEGELRYVGQSVNVRQRINSHGFRYRFSGTPSTPHGASKTLVIKVRGSEKYGDWAMIELRLINRLKPIGNMRWTGVGAQAIDRMNWSADKGLEDIPENEHRRRLLYGR